MNYVLSLLLTQMLHFYWKPKSRRINLLATVKVSVTPNESDPSGPRCLFPGRILRSQRPSPAGASPAGRTPQPSELASRFHLGQCSFQTFFRALLCFCQVCVLQFLLPESLEWIVVVWIEWVFFFFFFVVLGFRILQNLCLVFEEKMSERGEN